MGAPKTKVYTPAPQKIEFPATPPPPTETALSKGGLRPATGLVAEQIAAATKGTQQLAASFGSLGIPLF